MMNKNISKVFLSLVCLIFISSNVFSAPMCIIPRNIPNLSKITYPTYELYNIEPAVSKNGSVVIEIISGGRYDNGRNQYLNINTPQIINIWLDRETTPVYINCYEAEPSLNAQDGSSGWAKGPLLQTYSVSKDNFYYIDKSPEDQLNQHINDIVEQSILLNTRFNTLNNNIEDLADNILIAPTVIEDVNITSEYVTIERGNSIALFFGGILLIIGIFGAFSIVQKFFK